MTYTEQHIAEAKRRLAKAGWPVNHMPVELLAEALASPAWALPVDDADLRRQAIKDAFYAGFNAARNEDVDEAWLESETRKAFDRAALAGIRAGRAAERAGGE